MPALATNEDIDYTAADKRLLVFQQVVADTGLLADLIGADDPNPDEAQLLAKRIRDACLRLLVACMATVGGVVLWLELTANQLFL
jgi:hypothetical protein